MLLWGCTLSALHILLERWQALSLSDVALNKFAHPLDIALILCDAAFFFIEYSLLASSLVHFGPKKSISPAILLALLTILKHLINLLVFLIAENVTQPAILRNNAINAASAIAIELFQFVLVLLVLFLLRKREIQFPLLGTCVIMLIINLLSRIITDIDAHGRDIGTMIAFYSFDLILYGPAALFLMTWIATRQTKKDPT